MNQLAESPLITAKIRRRMNRDRKEAERTQRKRRYLVTPPELSDGQHVAYTAERDVGDWLVEAVKEWLDCATEGEALEISWAELTDEEFDALPSI